MQIAFRIDDVTEDMDWDRFERVMEILLSGGAYPLLGIVPCNQDENLKKGNRREDFWDYIRELKKKGCMLALHGCYHQYTTKKGGLFPLNQYSEFAGLTKQEQSRMIEEGKEALLERGIETDIFMAPAHSYDTNTLSALKQQGFRYITDGFGKRPYLQNGMHFLPICFQTSKAWKQKKGMTTIVLHTNTMEDGQIEELKKRITENQEKVCAFSQYMKQEAVRRGAPGRAGEYLLARLKHILVGLKNRGQTAGWERKEAAVCSRKSRNYP